MSTLAYTKLGTPPRFRDTIFWFLFFPLLISVAGSVLFKLFGDDPYLPEPDWLKAALRWSDVSVTVGYFFYTLPAAVYCGITIRRYKRSRKHFFGVWAGIILAFCSPLLIAPLPYPSRRNHRPFVFVAAQARGLAQSSCVYAFDHGKFPAHLGILVFTGQVRERELVDRDMELQGWKPPTPLPPEVDWHAYATDVEAGSIFIYAGADLPGSAYGDAEIVLLYTKPGRRVLPGHRVIAFADARAELVDERKLPAIFGRSNAARARYALPPFRH